LGTISIEFASHHEWSDNANKSVTFTLSSDPISSRDDDNTQAAKKIYANITTGEFYKM